MRVSLLKELALKNMHMQNNKQVTQKKCYTIILTNYYENQSNKTMVSKNGVMELVSFRVFLTKKAEIAEFISINVVGSSADRKYIFA